MRVDDITFYTDGSNESNGVLNLNASCAVVIVEQDKTIQIAKYLGGGTNNYAEIMGIGLAVDLIHEKYLSKNNTVVTDSRYCEGLFNPVEVLFGKCDFEFNARLNKELVYKIREKIRLIPRFRVQHCKGHSNNKYNNIADRLARDCRLSKKDYHHEQVNDRNLNWGSCGSVDNS